MVKDDFTGIKGRSDEKQKNGKERRKGRLNTPRGTKGNGVPGSVPLPKWGSKFHLHGQF
jgi:hypothetical protein